MYWPFTVFVSTAMIWRPSRRLLNNCVSSWPGGSGPGRCGGAGSFGGSAGVARRGVGRGASAPAWERVRVPGRAPWAAVPGGDVRGSVPVRAGPAISTRRGDGRGDRAADAARLVGFGDDRRGHVRSAGEGRGRLAGHA